MELFNYTIKLTDTATGTQAELSFADKTATEMVEAVNYYLDMGRKTEGQVAFEYIEMN